MEGTGAYEDFARASTEEDQNQQGVTSIPSSTVLEMVALAPRTLLTWWTCVVGGRIG